MINGLEVIQPDPDDEYRCPRCDRVLQQKMDMDWSCKCGAEYREVCILVETIK